MNLYVQSESTAARRKFTFVCVDDTDGKTPKTGLTFSSSEVSVRKPAGSYAAITNIATIAEVADGEYEGEFTATELNTLGPLLVKIKKTNVRTTIIAVGQVVAANLYDGVRLGLTALPNVAAGAGAGALITAASDTQGSVIYIDSSERVAANVFAVSAGSVTSIQSGLATASSLSTVGANVSAIKTKTDNLPASPASSGDVSALASALASIPAGVWASVLDANAPANAQTALQILNLLASWGYGPKTENTDGSVTIRDPGDTKDRIAGSVANGVRTLTGADGS